MRAVIVLGYPMLLFLLGWICGLLDARRILLLLNRHEEEKRQRQLGRRNDEAQDLES
jgi:hypothetical protein